jgi:hypothetical protein
MADRTSILNAVKMAIRNTNEALPPESRIEPNESERILGHGTKLSSLGFVTLMVAIEQEIEATGGKCPNLTEDLSDPVAGVATIGELIDYLAVRV